VQPWPCDAHLAARTGNTLTGVRGTVVMDLLVIMLPTGGPGHTGHRVRGVQRRARCVQNDSRPCRRHMALTPAPSAAPNWDAVSRACSLAGSSAWPTTPPSRAVSWGVGPKHCLLPRRTTTISTPATVRSAAARGAEAAMPSPPAAYVRQYEGRSRDEIRERRANRQTRASQCRRPCGRLAGSAQGPALPRLRESPRCLLAARPAAICKHIWLSVGAVTGAYAGSLLGRTNGRGVCDDRRRPVHRWLGSSAGSVYQRH